MDVAAVVIEDLDLSHSSIKAETSGLQTLYDHQVEIRAHRFTFLSKTTSLRNIPKLPPESFLASAILINFRQHEGGWKSYLFRAIVTLPRYKHRTGKRDFFFLLLNDFIHIYKTFSCEVAISDAAVHPFVITGTVFCQQNSVTSVCAHAALCMAINNQALDDRPLVQPEDINRILKVDHHAVKLNLGRDIYRDDLEKVFNAYNLSITPLQESYKRGRTTAYSDYIYKYIESRCPVLLIFTTDDDKTDHVIPIFGHTLNTDMWTPEAELAYSRPKSRFKTYKSTSAWVDHFIIHDDNFGMYYCLPKETIKQPRTKNHRPFRARFAIAIVPNGVTTPPREAEWAAVLILDALFKKLNVGHTTLDQWSERLAFSRPVVTRTLLVTRDEYAASLDKYDFDGTRFENPDKENLTRHLPQRFWLSEITMPDIYSANHAKIIDFFYRCDQAPTNNTKDMLKRSIQVRFPGALIVRRPQLVVELSVRSHYPLFEFGRDIDVPRW